MLRKLPLGKKPSVAGKRQSVKGIRVGKKQRDGRADNSIETVVFPAELTRPTLAPALKKQVEFAELTWQKHQQELYINKKEELDRMYVKMREACIELEKTDADLFRQAMVRELGQYMPIQRRVMTDTLPEGGWNHENALSTAVKK